MAGPHLRCQVLGNTFPAWILSLSFLAGEGGSQKSLYRGHSRMDCLTHMSGMQPATSVHRPKALGLPTLSSLS